MSALAKAASFVCVLLVIIFGESSGQCPDGWRAHRNTCYLYGQGMYNWFNAKATCETLKSQLVEIESNEENTFLTGFIHSLGEYHHPWIGLADFEEESVFRWISSSEVPEESHWSPGKPDDGLRGADCAYMKSTGLWFDGRCELDHRTFICEKEAIEMGENAMIG